MALWLVATPIGDPQDISLRALELLKKAELIILEEFKESTQILRYHQLAGKKYEQLNEHSTKDDFERLSELCRSQDIPLITDCGTPGFCDPGADLVHYCRQKKIPVRTVPGASSLMALLSLSSQRLDQFLFRGFLPAENEARKKEWQALKNEKKAFVIMDTPYRFQKTIMELAENLPHRTCLLGINLTGPDEIILEISASQISNQSNLPNKAEFMLLIYADASPSRR